MFIEVTYQNQKYTINAFYVTRFTKVGKLTHLTMKDGSTMAVEESYDDVKALLQNLYLFD